MGSVSLWHLRQLASVQRAFKLSVDSETLFKFGSKAVSEEALFDGVSGIYFVDRHGKVRISQDSCGDLSTIPARGSSYSTPRGGVAMIRDYLDDLHGN